jgi:hypothetical protein
MCALAREPRRGLPNILARLRRDVEHRLDEPTAPPWARPLGWAIAVVIIVIVVIAAVSANPL